jgi:type IV pilus assembly protein PilO
LIDFQQLAMDFKTLDPKDPGLWPLAPRIVILLSLFVGLIAAAWGFGAIGWSVQLEELEAKKQQEAKHKEDWLAKKKQAVNLDEYRRQLAEIDRSFGALLKQLPNKAEMGDMLVDINKAAQARGLRSSCSVLAVKRPRILCRGADHAQPDRQLPRHRRFHR